MDDRTTARRRTVPGSAGALPFSTVLMGYLRRVVLGGLLMCLGFSFRGRWLISARRKLPTNEYLVIGLILIVIAVAGLSDGVFTGLLAASILFLRNYSRTSVVHTELSGVEMYSTVERGLDEEDTRRRHAGQIHLFRLRGHLFSGTVAQLSIRLTARSAKKPGPWLRFALLDLEQVTGIDASVPHAVRRMQEAARRTDFTLGFTGPPPRCRSVGTSPNGYESIVLSVFSPTLLMGWNGAKTVCSTRPKARQPARHQRCSTLWQRYFRSPGKASHLTSGAVMQMKAEKPECASALPRFVADLLARRLLHATRPLESVIP